MSYWYGRLTNILVVFDPIEMDEYEEDDMPDFRLMLVN